MTVLSMANSFSPRIRIYYWEMGKAEIYLYSQKLYTIQYPIGILKMTVTGILPIT